MRRVSWEDHTAYRGAVELESTGSKQRKCIMFRFRMPARIRLIDGGEAEASAVRETGLGHADGAEEEGDGAEGGVCS
jgi:hypothetical protein